MSKEHNYELVEGDQVYYIPTFHIWVEDDFNCRTVFTDESIEDLAGSIEQSGLLFPVDVQPAEEIENIPPGFRFKLICGFRRLAAHKLLGEETIKARIRENLTPREASIINLTENLERKDLTILEEALAIDKLFPPYRTIKSIAEEIKKPLGWVTIRRNLLLLSPWIQKAAASGRFTSRDLQTIQCALDPDEKAKDLLNAMRKGIGHKSKILYNGKYHRKKVEIKTLMAKLLAEGFNPQLLRLLGWSAGEVNDDELEEALTWLRNRLGWLK